MTVADETETALLGSNHRRRIVRRAHRDDEGSAKTSASVLFRRSSSNRCTCSAASVRAPALTPNAIPDA
jgi:hypothetical protein